MDTVDACHHLHIHCTGSALQEFWDVIGPIAEAEDVNTINDVYRAIDGDLSSRVDEIDERMWDAAEELTQRVPLTYGPAVGAGLSGGAGSADSSATSGS